MAAPITTRTVLAFSAKFLVLAPLCLVGWLYIMPAYASFLANVTGWILKHVFGEPIETMEAVNLDPGSFLNTGMGLAFGRTGLPQRAMPDLGKLITNIAPYVALVLATAGLGIVRRLKVLVIGVGIIILGHIVMVVILFGSHKAALPKAVGFVAITLPFLLWIVLAFWDKVTAYFADEEPPSPAKPPVSPS
jgi:hypothetical protein